MGWKNVLRYYTNLFDPVRSNFAFLLDCSLQTEDCLHGSVLDSQTCSCAKCSTPWSGAKCNVCTRDPSFCKHDGVLEPATCTCKSCRPPWGGADCSGAYQLCFLKSYYFLKKLTNVCSAFHIFTRTFHTHFFFSHLHTPRYDLPLFVYRVPASGEPLPVWE